MLSNTVKVFHHVKNVDELWSFFQKHCQEMNLQKGQSIPTTGILGHVKKGVLGSFLTENEKIHCIDLFTADDVFIDLFFVKPAASLNSTLKCIHPCCLEVITRSSYEKLIGTSNENNNLARLLMEHLYINDKRRLLAHYSQTPFEIYQQMALSNKLQHIPKKTLASYLNVTPETLSRMIKKSKSYKDA